MKHEALFRLSHGGSTACKDDPPHVDNLLTEYADMIVIPGSDHQKADYWVVEWVIA
jgi:hypothetical protein